MIDQFFKWAITNVDEADVVVFSIAASGRRLVAVLKPVRAHDVGISKSSLNVVGIEFAAVGLAIGTSNTHVQRASVQ